MIFSKNKTNCSQYLIYQENKMWRVACTDGRMYSPSGLYVTKDEAIEAVEQTGQPYQVVEGRKTYELF